MRIARILPLVLFVLGAYAPAALAAEAWTVRKEESRLGFTAKQQGQDFDGAFQRFEADIRFSPEDLTGSKVVVVVDITSFHTGSAQRDDNYGGADWFAIKAFPEARFETKHIGHRKDGRFEALADLTIRDKTQEIRLPFSYSVTDGVARVEGETVIDRRDFDIGLGQWASGDTIGHLVKVSVSLVADKAL